jgi:hypothetical protein
VRAAATAAKVTGNRRSGGRAGRADRTVRHPALAGLDARVLTRDLPERLLFCGGAILIEAAGELARIRNSALEMRP